MSGEDLRSRWDRLAGRYDDAIPWFAGRYDEVRARIRRDLAGTRLVLEIGAGTGQFTADVAAVSERVVASDLAPEMLRRLATRTAALANVEVEEQAADRLDFPDGRFDAVLCANVLHVTDRPAEALREIGRVLRAGGMLVAPTFCHGETWTAAAVSRLLGLVSPFVAHTRFSAQSLAGFVRDHGFDVERAENLGGVLPLVYVRARRAAPPTPHFSDRNANDPR